MIYSQFPFAVLAAVMPAAWATSLEPVNLTYKWPIGETLVYRVTQDSTQKMTGTPAGDMQGSTHQVSTLNLKPTGVAEDGSATLEVSFQTIRLEMQPLMQPTKLTYDTAAPGEDEAKNPLSAVKAMIGKPFTVVLGPDGSVKKIDGVQAIADQIGQQAGGNPAAATMARQLKTTFNDQTISKLFEVGFHHVPGRAVEPGSTWDSSYDMPLPGLGTMKAAGQATLSKAEGATATVESAYTITLEPPAPGQQANPMMQNLKVENASGKSTTQFDVEKGLLRHHTGTVTMPTSLSMNGPNGQPTTITILIDSGTTLDLVEGKP
jgi:hypothetical protein